MHLEKKYILLIIAFHFLLTPDSISGQNEFEQLLIVTPKNSHSVVQNAIADLLQFLNSNKFYKIEISTDPTSFSQQTLTVLIVSKDSDLIDSGNYATLKTDVNLLTDQEALIIELSSAQKNRSILITGGDNLGVQYAVFELMNRITFNGSKIKLSENIFYRDKPEFQLRGMYAHLHWQYHNPYALRSWSLNDWKNYIDLLARMRFNLLQIWSFVGSLPIPLSESDFQFLKRFKHIIDYAKNQRGFEVWIGECANNIAENDDGTPIETREYFKVEVNKNPASPKEYQEIMNNRANLYREVDNADGYWIIDSDPGGYNGSVDSDFVNIFLGNRKLIDKYCQEPNNVKMLYWIWDGWNIATRNGFLNNPESWFNVLSLLKEKLKEPWWTEMAGINQIPIVDNLGLTSKTIYFPYNAIEWEPSTPHTTLRFAKIDSVFQLIDSSKNLKGVLGNAQTPYVQLPTIAYFAQKAWNSKGRRKMESDVLDKIAKIISNSNSEILSEAWKCLQCDDFQKLDEIINALTLLKASSDKFQFIIDDLILQLKIRMYGLMSIEAAKVDSANDLSVALGNFAMMVLKWQSKTGYFGSVSPGSGRLVKYPICGPMLWQLRKELKNVSLEYFQAWKDSNRIILEKEFDPEIVKYVLDEIDGSRVPIRFHLK